MTGTLRVPYTLCPICESRDIVAYGSADCTKHVLYRAELPSMMNWLTCKSCGHYFTEGYYTEEALALIFSKTNEHQKVGNNVEKDRFTWSKIVDKIDGMKPLAGGVWLDIGFGNGSLLFTAAEWGYEAVGIDLRKEGVDAMRSLGFEAHCVELTTFEQFGRFDVISMADVLEHMPFPGKALLHVHKLLKPEGRLFVSMPNMDSIVWRAMDQQKGNPYWGEIEHYHNFSRGRLYDLLRRSGFEPVRYGVSERYRVCMEVISIRKQLLP